MGDVLVGWWVPKLSSEDFVKNLNFFDQLTLRASYGGQGNDGLSTLYAYQSLYAFYNNLGEGGTVASRLPTPHLKWETNLNLNVGLEFAILNNRIRGNVEYFKRQSKDLLFTMPLAPSVGFNGYSDNIGELQNTGFEISLQTTPVKTENFRWDLDINATTTKNKITKLPKGSIVSGTKLLQVGGSSI